MFHIEAIPDYNIEIITTTTGVAHDAQIPHTGVMAINPAMTHHTDCTADHLQTEAHHITPEIEATHIHVHPIYPHDKIHIGHTYTPVDHKANHITRRMPEGVQKINTWITIALMTILATQERRQVI